MPKISVIFSSFVICCVCFVFCPSVSCCISDIPISSLMLLFFWRLLPLIVQVSLQYNKTGRASVIVKFYSCFLKFFCGLNTLFKGLFLQPTLMHNSITTCMSHYYPRHVSGLDMPILRRNNCTNTASGLIYWWTGFVCSALCNLMFFRPCIII